MQVHSMLSCHSTNWAILDESPPNAGSLALPAAVPAAVHAVMPAAVPLAVPVVKH